MADAIFRADLIKSLESEIGRVAAVQAAEIMLSEASEAQIGEVRDLLVPLRITGDHPTQPSRQEKQQRGDSDHPRADTTRRSISSRPSRVHDCTDCSSSSYGGTPARISCRR